MKPSNIAGYYKQHGKLATGLLPGLLLTALLAGFTATAMGALIAGTLTFTAALLYNRYQLLAAPG